MEAETMRENRVAKKQHWLWLFVIVLLTQGLPAEAQVDLNIQGRAEQDIIRPAPPPSTGPSRQVNPQAKARDGRVRDRKTPKRDKAEKPG